MIEIHRLTTDDSTGQGVHDVSFSAGPGRVTALFGSAGSGGGTVLRAVCGLVRPRRGTVRVLGRPYARLPHPRRQVGIHLGPGDLDPARSGWATLADAALLVDVPDYRIDAVLRRVGLTSTEVQVPLGRQSLLIRQRVAVARALLGEPRVLLLDEPHRGGDVAAPWLRNVTRRFAADGGTVLLTCTRVVDARSVADDAVVMIGGRVILTGPARTVLGVGDDPADLLAAVSA